MSEPFLRSVSDANRVITAIDNSIRFPEILEMCRLKYHDHILSFKELIASSSSSGDLLRKVRSTDFSADQRMAFLKMFRRCISPVLDTEMAKKVTKVSTDSLIESLGHTFKPIAKLQNQFANLTEDQESALAALIGEYDTRGQLGYILTGIFFDWFEECLGNKFSLEGPRGAGRDIELSTVFDDFVGSYPCDFIIKSKTDHVVRAIGFARYDSTRGGAQSDDRTGGNSDKVSKAKEFCTRTGKKLKLIFLADGPGLVHRDTWEEACKLDGAWSGEVRVTTLKTAVVRVTEEWLLS